MRSVGPRMRVRSRVLPLPVVRLDLGEADARPRPPGTRTPRRRGPTSSGRLGQQGGRLVVEHGSEEALARDRDDHHDGDEHDHAAPRRRPRSSQLRGASPGDVGSLTPPPARGRGRGARTRSVSAASCSATRSGAVPPAPRRLAIEPSTVSTGADLGREVRRHRRVLLVGRLVQLEAVLLAEPHQLAADLVGVAEGHALADEPLGDVRRQREALRRELGHAGGVELEGGDHAGEGRAAAPRAG